jgi:hypothetical protein
MTIHNKRILARLRPILEPARVLAHETPKTNLVGGRWPWETKGPPLFTLGHKGFAAHHIPATKGRAGALYTAYAIQKRTAGAGVHIPDSYASAKILLPHCGLLFKTLIEHIFRSIILGCRDSAIPNHTYGPGMVRGKLPKRQGFCL